LKSKKSTYLIQKISSRWQKKDWFFIEQK
jgi:hypothetical protein